MFRIKNLKHADIQRELKESLWSVERIKQSLGIDKPVTPQELYRLVINDLRNMHFDILDEPGLSNVSMNQSIPAFVKYKTSDRTEGGTLKLNPDYSAKERLEALFHEYIHIKDHSLPLSTTHTASSENKTLFYGIHNDGDIMNQARVEDMLDDLKRMNFNIIYANISNIPAVTIFNTLKRTDGGIIKLNPNFSTYEQLAALYREYLSIIDYSLPIYEIYNSPPDGKVELDKFYQKQVEFQADMRTYELLMPREELKQRLLENAYDIDEILKQYCHMEESSVLQWITIISGIPCHFAWIMYKKNNDNIIIRGLVCDNCYYNGKDDPQPFGIETVLDTTDSAAALAIKKCHSVHKESIINGKEYFCYAYYESDLSKELRKNTTPDPVSICYDRLLVIGWEKTVYDTIQCLLKLIKPPHV